MGFIQQVDYEVIQRLPAILFTGWKQLDHNEPQVSTLNFQLIERRNPHLVSGAGYATLDLDRAAIEHEILRVPHWRDPRCKCTFKPVPTNKGPAQ
ncbi:hypothetical protein TI01_1067 [Lysobacter sp. A03]|nr:hypothetical protein TI01_1067 [Lysobacter sp. A03]